MPADATLHFMEQVAQLHEDDQAGHGQPDVAKQLRRKERAKHTVRTNVNLLVTRLRCATEALIGGKGEDLSPSKRTYSSRCHKQYTLLGLVIPSPAIFSQGLVRN